MDKICPNCEGWTETLLCPECGNIESLYDDSLGDGYRVCSNSKCKQEYYTNINYCQTCKGESTIPEDKIREELAEYAHNQWSGWMKYLFSKCEQNVNGTMTIPKWAVDRWKKQIITSYTDLSETEKDSDRSEADGILKIISHDEESIDQIREEFEKEWRFHDGDNYPFGVKRLCLLFYTSRDEEIKQLQFNKKVSEESLAWAVKYNYSLIDIIDEIENICIGGAETPDQAKEQALKYIWEQEK